VPQYRHREVQKTGQGKFVEKGKRLNQASGNQDAPPNDTLSALSKKWGSKEVLLSGSHRSVRERKTRKSARLTHGRWGKGRAPTHAPPDIRGVRDENNSLSFEMWVLPSNAERLRWERRTRRNRWSRNIKKERPPRGHKATSSPKKQKTPLLPTFLQ